MRRIHFADDTERTIAEHLDALNIEFIHESENKNQELDFYLPKYDVYIEVKRFHTDRVFRQMASKNNVIVIQGIHSVNLFKAL